MKVTIEIPDNCELVKDGEKYIVKEKNPPRTWEEFCEKTPVKDEEYFMNTNSDIIKVNVSEGYSRNYVTDRNLFIDKKEAEAFLALMQLRQLRKAWVGDWEPKPYNAIYGIFATVTNIVQIGHYDNISRNLTFPTKEMAEDFLNCFKDLCETAKMLL